jgi:hypothetical protein
MRKLMLVSIGAAIAIGVGYSTLLQPNSTIGAPQLTSFSIQDIAIPVNLPVLAGADPL